MAGGETLNAILDGMDEEMLGGYDEYAQACVEGWESFTGNHGQMVLVSKHIIPAAEQHAIYARTDWPETAGPDQYLEAIYGCYDPEVIESAFGDTLNQIYEELMAYWEESSSIQYEHAALLSSTKIGDDNEGPHSTHAVWRGGPYGPTM